MPVKKRFLPSNDFIIKFTLMSGQTSSNLNLLIEDECDNQHYDD